VPRGPYSERHSQGFFLYGSVSSFDVNRSPVTRNLHNVAGGRTVFRGPDAACSYKFIHP
jgi:hypothetical protein